MQGDDLHDRYRHPRLRRTYLQLVNPLLVAILPLLDTTCRRNMRLPHLAKIATLSEIDRWLTHGCIAVSLPHVCGSTASPSRSTLAGLRTEEGAQSLVTVIMHLGYLLAAVEIRVRHLRRD